MPYNRICLNLWDLATHKERRVLVLPKDLRCGWVMTPDGKSLVIGTIDRGALVFSLETGKLTKTLQSNEPARMGTVTALAVSADGKTLAVGTAAGGREGAGDGSVFVWDLEKGKLRQHLPDAGQRWPDGPLDHVTLLAFSPDGTRLVSGGFRADILQIWDPATGKNLDFLRIGHAIKNTEALAFSPDGKTLAVGGASRVELWDVAMEGFRDDFSGWSSAGEIVHLAFSPDGKTLVSAAREGPVEFWDVPAGAPKGVRQDTRPPYRGLPKPFTNQPGAGSP